MVTFKVLPTIDFASKFPYGNLLKICPFTFYGFHKSYDFFCHNFGNGPKSSVKIENAMVDYTFDLLNINKKTSVVNSNIFQLEEIAAFFLFWQPFISYTFEVEKMKGCQHS